MNIGLLVIAVKNIKVIVLLMLIDSTVLHACIQKIVMTLQVISKEAKSYYNLAIGVNITGILNLIIPSTSNFFSMTK